MLMNRDYLDILRRLRTIEMTAHARKRAQQEARRAVLIVEVLARAMDDHDWRGGRLVLRVIARLRGFSRALRNAQERKSTRGWRGTAISLCRMISAAGDPACKRPRL